MKKTNYLTAPIPSKNMPKGIPYIVGNEAAERFSYYGMRSILVIFMTQYLLNSAGELDLMSETAAKKYYHLFCSAVYFIPLLGSLLSDIFWGKYKTILLLSIVYCFGHLALAIDETRLGLAIGLSLIALGSGGIKPCVSAHVGDQFGKTNQHLLTKVFGWFYFSINFGSFFSMALIPITLDKFGPSVAFGIPGILMFIATVAFWMGRNKFVHIPPGGKQFIKETFSKEGLTAVLSLSILFLFVAMFFSLFEQTGSAWVLQAKNMNRMVWGYELLPSQLQAINPLLIMILIPVFNYGLYPFMNRFFSVTPIRKMGIGLFITAVSFAIPALIETRIVAGGQPHIFWQIPAYILLTCGEVMVSITAIEFAYTQSPKKMKSFIMAIYLLAIFLGNFFTFLVNHFIEIIHKPDGTSMLEGPNYYWFFTILMFVTAILYIFYAKHYKMKNYIQDEEPDENLNNTTD